MQHGTENRPQGGIILLSGLSGVGKSTLIQCALTDYPGQLQYLKNFTTRAKRSTDNDTEYTFVDDDTFDQQRKIAKDWQEGNIYDNRYGHDTATYRKLMQRGKFLIGCCYPSLEDAQSLDENYDPSLITVVHVDLPEEVRAERLLSQRGEEGRLRLTEDASWTMTDSYRMRVDFLFNANKNRDENRFVFNALLGQIFRNSTSK